MSRRRLLIYQMAKVASMSWVVLGREQFGVDDAFHIHHLADESLELFRSILAESGPRQTIARMMIVRERLRSGERLRALLASSLQEGEPWLAVTGIREPVARSASLLCYFADFLGCTSRNLSFRDGATIETLDRFFRETWDRVLADEPPTDTFGRIVHFYMRNFEDWFSAEFRAVLGIDVAAAPFPAGPTERLIAQGGTRALVYRVEDMRPAAPGHETLRASAETFGGAAVPGFPVNNATEGRRTEPLYRAFLERLRLPPEMLDRIYAGPTMRKFYTPQEIDAFTSRWSG